MRSAPAKRLSRTLLNRLHVFISGDNEFLGSWGKNFCRDDISTISFPHLRQTQKYLQRPRGCCLSRHDLVMIEFLNYEKRIVKSISNSHSLPQIHENPALAAGFFFVKSKKRPGYGRASSPIVFSTGSQRHSRVSVPERLTQIHTSSCQFLSESAESFLRFSRTYRGFS